MADGLCGRDKVVLLAQVRANRSATRRASPTGGAAALQVRRALRGTLFKSMLTTDGAELLAAFGTRPVFEADLIVEVADPCPGRAPTPLAALKAMRSYAPSSSCLT